MKVEKVPIEQAVGHILIHNQVDPTGRRVLRKGRLLQAEDVATLQALGHTEVYIGRLAEADIDENEAAYRLGAALGQPHLQRSTARTGRVDLTAGAAGIFKVNSAGLLALNDINGVAVATLADNSQVSLNQPIGTIKIIPYALPQVDLEQAEAIIHQNQPLIELRPFSMKNACLITTGSPASHQKVVESFTPALRNRLATYNVELVEGPYVAEDETVIAKSLREALDSAVGMVLIAGETSIMDLDDITPRAIKAVGGEVVHHGVPVEPGNLLLLAYWGQTPIVGAPGCARSNQFNVVDMVLPRLASGERLSRRDLAALGHGGYLK